MLPDSLNHALSCLFMCIASAAFAATVYQRLPIGRRWRYVAFSCAVCVLAVYLVVTQHLGAALDSIASRQFGLSVILVVFALPITWREEDLRALGWRFQFYWYEFLLLFFLLGVGYHFLWLALRLDEWPVSRPATIIDRGLVSAIGLAISISALRLIWTTSAGRWNPQR